MHRILLVEDDDALRNGIALALRSGENELIPCACLADAREFLRAHKTELVVLDVNLPDGSGMTLLRELRAAGGGPAVILLTACDLETDIVAGLETGADDYITKPFSLAVLRARVNTQLRKNAAQPGEAVAQGPFRFDFSAMEFSKNGTPISLSKTEQRLLRLLALEPGRTFPRELLLDRIWSGGAEFVEENALSVAVKRLRDKLEDVPSRPRYLRTVYGIGYRWVVGEDA